MIKSTSNDSIFNITGTKLLTGKVTRGVGDIVETRQAVVVDHTPSFRQPGVLLELTYPLSDEITEHIIRMSLYVIHELKRFQQKKNKDKIRNHSCNSLHLVYT